MQIHTRYLRCPSRLYPLAPSLSKRFILFFSLWPTNIHARVSGAFDFYVEKRLISIFLMAEGWWHGDNHVISLGKFSSKHKSKWPVIVAFSNFCGVVWAWGKLLPSAFLKRLKNDLYSKEKKDSRVIPLCGPYSQRLSLSGLFLIWYSVLLLWLKRLITGL